MGKTISFVKGKGSISHDNRDFIADNVDKDRMKWDVTYIKQPLREAYEQVFGDAVREYNDKQKRSDRKIDDYLNKIKNSGNNEKQFYEIVVQVGKKDDTGVLDENGNLSAEAIRAKEVLDEYARSFQERNPNLYLFNAVLHMDEATPHLHLDYIPVAHGYKTGLSVRNSLTKGLQEMGIAPAAGKNDNETMHWQERERAYISELCQEHGIEIDVIGENRDSYTIPEYKQAMKEKEEAEAQIEILNAEKIEAEAALARIGNQLSNGEDEIDVQKEKLEEIKKQIADTKKAVAEKTYLMDAMIVSGEPVEKEIQKIRDQAKDATGIFDKQPMVKIPQKTFDDMLSRYRIAGTFERLYKEFTQKLNKMQARMESLKSKNSDIEGKLEQVMSFIKERKLSEAFQEFIRPKSLRERLDGYKARVESQKQKSRDLTHDKNKGVAI